MPLAQIQLDEYDPLAAENRHREDQDRALLAIEAPPQGSHTLTDLQQSEHFTQDASNNDRDEMLKFKTSLDNFKTFLESIKEGIPATVRTQIQEMIQEGELLGRDLIATYEKELSSIRNDLSTTNTKLRDVECKILDIEQKNQSLLQSVNQIDKITQSIKRIEEIMQSMSQ